MEKQPAVYILAKDRNGTLYTGVTGSLVDRIWQHKEHMVDGFTSRYNVTRLVWYEMHATMDTAIRREKTDQEMATRMEDRIDREGQSLLERLVAGDPGIARQGTGFPLSRE